MFHCYLLEVRLRVVPLLHQTVTQAQRCGLVALEVVEAVAAARHSVLNVAHDVLLDAQHVVLLVGICMSERECVNMSKRWGRLRLPGADRIQPAYVESKLLKVPQATQ